MGAFGRLLQARWGGTSHDVSTWKTLPSREEDSEERERAEFLRNYQELSLRYGKEYAYRVDESYFEYVEEEGYDRELYSEFCAWRSQRFG
jgi:hypothetical protein